MSSRERIYRALIKAYPRAFRDRHAECMLGTLVDGADDRSALAEAREIAALAIGGIRARGDQAHQSRHSSWRHGVATLLAALATVNLAVIGTAFWTVHHPPGRGIANGVSAWWLLAAVAAVALVVAIAFRRRSAAVAAAVAGLIPLGYDEWLQMTGRGNRDHFSLAAAQLGFQGPPMSPFWLFVAVVILIACAAWPVDSARARPSQRLAGLVGGALVIAALAPLSFYVLVAGAILGSVVSQPLGFLDRRLHGAGLALWAISLPYVFWWSFDSSPETDLMLAYLAILPVTGVIAWSARRHRRRLAT